MDWNISFEEMNDGLFLEKLSPVGVLLISVVLLIIFITEIFDRYCKPPDGRNVRSSFFVLYEYNVRRVYPCQERITHDTLFRGVESILRQGVSRPNVVSLVSVGRGAACTALSLAYNLAAVTMQLLNPLGTSEGSKCTLRGREFTTAEDYWEFNTRMVSLLTKFRVAIVTDFECLHPQVATMIATLANDATIPQPKAVIMVILDTGERFNVCEKKSTRHLSEIALRECLSPYLERTDVEDLVNTLTWRSCVIVNEPSHKPSCCPVCTPVKKTRTISFYDPMFLG